MKTTAVMALGIVVAMGMMTAPEANAQAKKKAAAATAQWTDCSKVEGDKRNDCIRKLPAIKGPVPIAGAAAAAPAATAAAPAPAAAAATGLNPSSPCAKVGPSKLEACLSRAPAIKGPGWAAFQARPAAKKK